MVASLVRTAGNFGEVRPNHFHMGWDISTEGRQGLPVRAVERGRIVRIKVSSVGLGKTLYVAHPGGYLTVYAHLREFIPEVEEVVRRHLMANEAYEDDWHLKKPIPVRKGQVIGYSGNTGGSRAPHLHFEVRETATEWAVNPALVGFEVKDERPPFFYSLALYPLGDSSVVRVVGLDKSVRTATEGQRLRLRVLTRGGREFYLPNVDSIQVWGRVGLAIAANDYQDDRFNKFGVYEIIMKVDQRPHFVMRKDKLSFSLYRFVNAHIDYSLKVRENKTYQRLFKLPYDRLPFYKTLENNGHIAVNARTGTRPVRIELADEYGNRSHLAFALHPLPPVVGRRLAQPDTLPDHLLATVPPDRSFAHRTPRFRLYLPAYLFYDTTHVTLRIDSPCAGCYSDVYALGDPAVAVHRRFLVRIRPHGLPDSLRPFAYIARHNGSSRWSYIGAQWDGEYLKGRPRGMGDFAVRLDTVPPAIRFRVRTPEVRFRRPRTVRVHLSDAHTGIRTYRVELDGQFYYPAYFDAKRSTLEITLDTAGIAYGRHRLEVIATDRVGNRRQRAIDIVKIR